MEILLPSLKQMHIQWVTMFSSLFYILDTLKEEKNTNGKGLKERNPPVKSLYLISMKYITNYYW